MIINEDGINLEATINDESLKVSKKRNNDKMLGVVFDLNLSDAVDKESTSELVEKVTQGISDLVNTNETQYKEIPAVAPKIDEVIVNNNDESYESPYSFTDLEWKVIQDLKQLKKTVGTLEAVNTIKNRVATSSMYGVEFTENQAIRCVKYFFQTSVK